MDDNKNNSPNLNTNDKNTSSENIEYELLKLDNQLCFSLYACSKEIVRKYKPLLDPYGLTYTGYIIMLVLWEQDNITVKDLGKRLFLDSGTLTPMLKKLESLNYIKRNRSSNDERNVFIELTNKGQDFKEEALQFPKSMICNLDLDPNYAGEILSSLHIMMSKLYQSEDSSDL